MNAPVDVTNLRLETPRLILRPWRIEDWPDLYAYASVPGVGEAAGWSHHQDPEESKQIVALFVREKKTLALELKETGQVIGSLGIEELDSSPSLPVLKRGRELGYVLSKAYWGRGLMTEAVQAVVRYCFETLNFDFLTCGYFGSNEPSRCVMEKCGFRFFTQTQFHTGMGTTEHCRLYIQYNPR